LRHISTTGRWWNLARGGTANPVGDHTLAVGIAVMMGVQIPGIRGPVLAGQSPKALSVVPTVDDNGSKVRLFLGVYWKTAPGPPSFQCPTPTN
jgi:hypothetical protein